MSEDFSRSFVPRHDAAHAQFVTGDPEPWLKLWSRREPVSVFGGFGYISSGWDAVSNTVRTASSRLSAASGYRNDIVLTQTAGDHAYTVSIEQCTACADGGPPREFALRVTQVYRLQDGEWRIVHRHGDIIQASYPAPDLTRPPQQPPPTAGESTGSAELDEAFFARMRAAHTEFTRGNPEPWMGMWTRRAPVSVFGAFGYASIGWDAVSASMRKASARYSAGRDIRHELAVKAIAGDFAYTAVIESYTASADGAPPAQERLRVTQLYRRDNGRWRVSHRHGDLIRPGDPTN